MAANDIYRALLAVEDVADRLRAAVARLRAAIKADTRILPPVPRRASPGGRWPEDLRRQLADALATRLPRGDTLTTIARKHSVSLGALSKFARRNGIRNSLRAAPPVDAPGLLDHRLGNDRQSH